ncbi:CYSTEINE-RICH SECRETORY PROTEIN-RELATED [Salix viminalis]|uniref:CYSTEINE-RICH SECRETORY PROTEIN-RELATED n=1 Tax=Salix viminalis TaxID=40686 RepID=A0A9Q0V704_SALVM|nr:CYSTEINE-RICH SECRETORY PROTEIN-RELATED [Salix viminalis]
MWRFAALTAIILLFSLPNHADSGKLSLTGKLNRQKPFLAAKLSTPAEFLSAHNKIRENHNLTLLAWDPKLAGYSRWWAETRRDECRKLLHSPNSPYGENLFWALQDRWNASMVVNYWGGERNLYNPNTNECINNSVCGHYTQIVWNTTRRVGCAHVLCHNMQGNLFACSYDPPGNIYYHGPFGGRFNKSIVYPPSSNNASSPLPGSQTGITKNKVFLIFSSTIGHPPHKS